MMNHKQIKDHLLGMSNAKLDYPFGKGIAVYKVDDKMFALVVEESNPVKISLRCDPLLAQTLREKYESVMPGDRLSKRHWNTILLTGQLSTEEVQDLIRHSYILATS